MIAAKLNSDFLYAILYLYNSIKKEGLNIKKTIILVITLIGKKDVNILLADDDKEDAEIFTEVIEEIAPGAKITKACNGEQLMKTLLSEKAVLPDIIFLDLNMPVKNGGECLTEIRANKKLQNIPVIIYSTSSSKEHIHETYKGGADYYVPKPDSFTDLRIVLKKIFEMDWDGHTRPRWEKFVLSPLRFR